MKKKSTYYKDDLWYRGYYKIVEYKREYQSSNILTLHILRVKLCSFGKKFKDVLLVIGDLYYRNRIEYNKPGRIFLSIEKHLFGNDILVGLGNEITGFHRGYLPDGSGCFIKEITSDNELELLLDIASLAS